MKPFYFHASVQHNSGRYWSVGVKTWAKDIEDASRIFLAWGSGVMCHPNCGNVTLSKITMTDEGKGFSLPNEPELCAEIRKFLDYGRGEIPT